MADPNGADHSDAKQQRTEKIDSASSDPFFRVRLINIDHVLTIPGPLDRTQCAFNAEGLTLRKVPILRIFGATPAGQRVCVHVHNVYPYCYIQYKGSLDPDDVLRYIHRLGRELNAAMAVSLRRNQDDPESNQFIAAIHLCKGINFYGYHVGYAYFLKISFVDPAHNYRLAAILESGGVMKTVFQPFEIHIRYQLQFMLDYNIFGCEYLDLDDVRFRLPIPDGSSIASDEPSPLDFRSRIWNRNSIPYAHVQSEEVHRGTHCEIEADASAPWIINRRRLKQRDIHNRFDEVPNASPSQNILVPSLSGLWDDEKNRRSAAGLPASIPTEDPTRDPRAYATGESPAWMSEDRMRLLLEKRLIDEKNKTLPRDRNPNHFTERPGLDQYIMTTFDAVEVFHPYQDQIHAADPYSQRTGPSASSKLYDLHHAISQSQRVDSDHTDPTPLSQPKEEATDDFDSKFFRSQEFNHRLQEAEKEDVAANTDPPSDQEDDVPDADVPDPNDTQVDAPGTPRKWQRTESAQSNSNMSTGSTFSKSPSSTPKKRRHAELLPEDAITPSASPSSRPSKEFHEDSVRKFKQVKHDRSTISTNGTTSTIGTTSTNGTNGSRYGHAMESARSTRVRFAEASPSPSERSRRSRSDAVEKKTKSAPSALLVPSDGAPRKRLLTFHEQAPSLRTVVETFSLFSIVRQVHPEPFFSDPNDVPVRPREYAGRMFQFQSRTLPYLRSFEHWHKAVEEVAPSQSAKTVRRLYWQYGPPPPTMLEARAWRQKEKIVEKQRSRRRRARLLSQIERLTQSNDFGFKISQHKATTLVMRDKQHMTTLAVEVLTTTRGVLFPDPAFDAIQSIIYSFQNEDENLQDTGSRPDLRTGLIIVAGEDMSVDRLGLSHLAVEVVEDELELFNTLIDLVRAFDPEIIVGWEIHSSSWGYIIERASKEYDFDLVPQIGRSIVHNTGRAGGKSDNYAYTQSSALRITGRHTLNLWRLMKGELTLNLYTLENVCYHLLHRRIPKFSHQTLTQWFKSGRAELIRKAILYYVDMVELELEIIAESEFVLRTAEFARIYGIDFFSVISRGSQFKVESIMLRIAKPENFVLISPSRAQVGKQNAAECLPLIMEPQSAFYKGPLIVLDFQSLYPSIMIAYNLCYSTCLGRVAGFKGTSKFGVTDYAPPKGLLSLLEKDVNISSNGLLFVKPSVRKSLLAKMLSEILDTRVMVKASMKGTKADKAFQRIQNARQLSLKLLANVTYGYTSASFSGRMPCVEIADAIVQTGRETLEKAMDLINGTEEWGAQVVYGDTDSLFVYLPGRTKDEAFKLGNTIADKVTSLNPRPVKLKFEKVYLPSVLLAKKRYVGFKYETLDEREPGFDAKGIETVRRDFHPAIQRMLEACIRILFRSRDLSIVKSYLQRQWRKILEGRVSPQDFIFAKEVRLGSYSDKVAPPPGAAVSSRRMLADPRSEPQYGERVPYIISQGEPRAKLNQQAVSPEAFLKNPQLQINALYYITRTIIPPLARVFNLLGADVESWFHEMPKPNNAYWNKRPTAALLSAVLAQQSDAVDADAPSSSPKPSRSSTAVTTLNSHYATETCLLCSTRTEALVCLDCRQSPGESIHAVSAKLHKLESQASAIDRICSTCAGMERPGAVECVSFDCPYTYQKARLGKSLEDSSLVHTYLSGLFDSKAQRSAAVQDAWTGIEDGDV
ncbi:DNA-directed DNA polymerase, family B, multifunctional domain protein [Kalmanozyma brasiliensis GHG001]|uniref:DNA polymerase n=1 Tax=Kalmanozyma brasiliensis (strain GHG001) TaxID=1365824 RepID=V5EYM2_KALBG|nr:DNA-directed DNA polymerase, family B, multifunctional domain protein [Kalmanozyma brasiliensis GHG001]EST07879.1 DNA-directed DNA polymerase, family B, multifunctional domain protein [Kalmanozyma brasiliensis GHG001]